jgi:hypothetical protein
MELGAVLIGLVIAAYVIDVLWWPDRPCRVCGGRGRMESPLPFARDASRPCWWCRGAKSRKRWRGLRR